MEDTKHPPDEALAMALLADIPPEEEDDGLILWMLSMSPKERLEFAQGFIDSIQVLRNGRRA
jgi:hypothetical protein